VVRLSRDDLPVGSLQGEVFWHEDKLVARIAWVIGVPWQRHGYATEAAGALIDWLDDRGVTEVRANIHPDHHVSGAVARRAGLAPTADTWNGEVIWRRDHPARTGPADPLIISAYDPVWPELFGQLAGRLRARLGSAALRIDHIGSTAIVGLDAKPIIDVQISVASLEPIDAYRGGVESCGFVWRADNPELTKRYFREKPGHRRTHIHVRAAGSFDEQFSLLFRDYLRAHPERGRAYATLKHQLAPLLRGDRSAYVEAKDPFIWETIRLADDWAQQTGWAPGPSDA
jgi:GrpB-like predicted nucleotidyltransferase (UPF0157 family)